MALPEPPVTDAYQMMEAERQISILSRRDSRRTIVGSNNDKGDEDLEKSYGTEYEGEGTVESPYVVVWLEDEKENPYNWGWKRYVILMNLASSMIAIAFGSTTYGGSILGLEKKFPGLKISLAELGLSLYVLGFAIGPLLWGPFSEVLGRRKIFIACMLPFTLFSIGCAAANNFGVILFCRFMQGFLGAGPLNNSAGSIGDIFSSNERSAAMSVFALAAYLGPSLGPPAGDFVGQYLNYRWNFWIVAILGGVTGFTGALIPETYGPLLLTRKAARLTAETGHLHKSEYDMKRDMKETLSHKLVVSCQRPFTMLAREMIVLSFSIYIAFFYGTLYLFFGAFPIIFGEIRGWSMGISGLPFLGMGVGQIIGIGINLWDSRRYSRLLAANGGQLPPEARMPMAVFGALLLPVSLFWMAWTTSPSVPWIVCVMSAAPFGMGSVVVFLPLVNYMVDTYKWHAASALAANAVFRSLFGCAFPLFTTIMFHKLGPHVALSILGGFSILLCPIPFVFMKYGPRIRARSAYAPSSEDVPVVVAR